MIKMRLNVIMVILLLSVSMILPGRSDALEHKDRPIKVLASCYPVYIMVLNVTRDVPGISVHNLTASYTGCPHDYVLTAADMKRIADADIFIENGAGLESFMDKVIVRYPNLNVITPTGGIELIKEGNAVNPHIWTSVANVIIQVNNLGKRLEDLDPSHALIYEKNTAEYADRLKDLDQKIRSELGQYKGMKIITFHQAFAYFGREYGLDIVGVVEREPGNEPSARELAGTIDMIRRSGVKAVFSEPQYPAQSAEVIAREAGVKVYMLDPAVTGPDNADAFIKIMEDNLRVLKNALS